MDLLPKLATNSVDPAYSTMASQGYVQVTLIWVVYAIAVVLLLAIASLFVYLYQTHRDRSAYVTTVCIFTITCLLATVLLLPVDVALVSSTTSSKHGIRKDWATQEKVDQITYTLEIVYYLLYSLDALLCLLVIPFTYFWYEEYDEVAEEEGSQTFGSRFWAAFKYTIVFVFFCVALFLVGFFVPVAKHRKGAHFDLDFFKRLLSENHGERALTFALGLLITIGIVIYCFYTAAGLALLPLTLIKSAPSISAPALNESTTSQLESNLERQRQLEGRAQGANGLSSKDQRELDALVREERTLRRHQRMAEENTGEGQNFFWRVWLKLGAILRPIKLILGVLLVVIVLLIFASMLITAVDKAKNSVCQKHCGYLLGHINIFQPVNWILVQTAKVFPIDYVIFMLITLLFFSASVIGIATIGIRLLWITIFRIRKAHTSPQALLIATVMLTLMTLGSNYAIAMLVAPQYATFGPQTFCDHPLRHPGEQPDCTNHQQHIIPCTETTDNSAAKNVCTPSVASTFLNRVTVNFPFFGVVDFWAQFVFMGIFLIAFVLLLFRTPKLSDSDADEDAIEEEEEGLLASTGRRFDATWQDITGRAGTKGQAGARGSRGEDD